jgi:predicted RecB family nuclease
MPLALSATTVKSWFQYRCERKTRYECMSGAERDAVPILKDVKDAPWAELGRGYERRVVDRLGQEHAILRPAIGEDYLSQGLSAAFLGGRRTERYASQLLLEAGERLRAHLGLTDEVLIRRCFADLVKVDRNGEGAVFQVIDIKATQRPTPFHKAQIAFYGLLLQSMLAELDPGAAVDPMGQVWCLAPGSRGEDGDYRIHPFRLEPYTRLVTDFFRHEVPRIARRVVSANWDDTFFHIYFKCEQCDYLSHCRRSIAESLEPARRDVSAVPGISHEAKRSLHRLGIKTVGELAQAHGLRRASRAGSWALWRRAETLSARAGALVAGQAKRLPSVASYLMPPRVDVGLYLVVDVDPVEDNLVALGYLRSEGARQEHTLRVLPDGRPEHEGEALVAVMGRLIADLAAIDRHNAERADAPERQRYAHIFLYEPSEGASLQEAVARHLAHPQVRSGLLHLVRMFPPEDVVPEPEFRGVHHLPATALRSVVEQLYPLPVMVSYDLRRVSQALAQGADGLSQPYSPAPPFAREFSSRLSIDVIRRLREGRMEAGAVEQDLRARLGAARALAEWLMADNAAAERRPDDRAFLRLAKRPFRFQATFDPLNAMDLEILQAFELLENRAGLLNALVALAQPFRQRRDAARCAAQMTLKRHWRTDWGSHGLLFQVPPESRESELSSSNLDLILTDDDPDIRLNPQIWADFEVRLAPDRPEFADRDTLLVNVAPEVFAGDDFQRLLRETPEGGWFLDKTFKDFTTARAAGFLGFLGGEGNP